MCWHARAARSPYSQAGALWNIRVQQTDTESTDLDVLASQVNTSCFQLSI